MGHVEPSTEDEWELLAAARAGDAAAFGRLYRRYAPYVREFLYARTQDRHLAEDLTSETFLRGLRSLGSVSRRAGRTPLAWFITIARNAHRDDVKSARHRREFLCLDTVPDGAHRDDVEALALATTHRREVADMLTRCVAGLTGDQRACLHLRFIEELPVEEVARRLGRSRAATRALQYRALRVLSEVVPPSLRLAS